MARRLRSDLPDGFFHVYARGTGGIAIYRDDDDRRAFLALLYRVVGRFFWRVHAFCLMSTHYHLVLDTSRERLSRGMQRLNGLYAQGFNQRHRRFGHLFADRFAARVIEDERYLATVCAYVVSNPVRTGICELPSQHVPWVASRYGLSVEVDGLALVRDVPADLDVEYGRRRERAHLAPSVVGHSGEVEVALELASLAHDLVAADDEIV